MSQEDSLDVAADNFPIFPYTAMIEHMQQNHTHPNSLPTDELIPADSARASLFDRFARFYDWDYRDYEDDLEAILQLADECRGPVLELGCGTGRVVVPLAAAGQRVTGVDISPALLAIAERKLADAGLSHSATLVCADLRSFELAEKQFALAICTSNTLMHLTTAGDQLAVLRNAYRHLRTNGVLVIDLFNPDIARLLEVNGLTELADRWRDDAAGADVFKWSVRTVDLAEQIQETLFIYEEVFDDGQVRRHPCPFTLRYLWRNEAELMLEKAGFVVDDVWGDLDGGQYDATSDHLVLLARRADAE